ncbi:transposase [Streptomyces sp. NBC_01727]|uniref:transposase n=1 Tax=Streptomyces sp. NBC_01727 TaxID=2975924 RepID=UPI003FA3B025
MTLAEIGAGRSRIPSASHLASWTGVWPGNYESASKSFRPTTRGSPASCARSARPVCACTADTVLLEPWGAASPEVLGRPTCHRATKAR